MLSSVTASILVGSVNRRIVACRGGHDGTPLAAPEEHAADGRRPCHRPP